MRMSVLLKRDKAGDPSTPLGIFETPALPLPAMPLEGGAEALGALIGLTESVGDDAGDVGLGAIGLEHVDGVDGARAQVVFHGDVDGGGVDAEGFLDDACWHGWFSGAE